MLGSDASCRNQGSPQVEREESARVRKMLSRAVGDASSRPKKPIEDGARSPQPDSGADERGSHTHQWKTEPVNAIDRRRLLFFRSTTSAVQDVMERVAGCGRLPSYRRARSRLQRKSLLWKAQCRRGCQFDAAPGRPTEQALRVWAGSAGSRPIRRLSGLPDPRLHVWPVFQAARERLLAAGARFRNLQADKMRASAATRSRVFRSDWYRPAIRREE